MKDTRGLEQVLRIDGAGCFAEVMLSGIHLDKVLINFLQYDKSAAKGQRQKGSVGIFMDMFEAQVLSRDIMSGRIATLAKIEKARMQKNRQKYANPVFTKQGGTPAARNNGNAIARLFELTPGSSQPWILCAKQGKAHETPEGLIVMDGKPEVTIRVPCTDAKLKEFALAIESVERVWEQLRYVPVVAPMMKIAEDRRRDAIDKAKANAAPAT